jgi:hypothetical protein
MMRNHREYVVTESIASITMARPVNHDTCSGSRGVALLVEALVSSPSSADAISDRATSFG